MAIWHLCEILQSLLIQIPVSAHLPPECNLSLPNSLPYLTGGLSGFNITVTIAGKSKNLVSQEYSNSLIFAKSTEGSVILRLCRLLAQSTNIEHSHRRHFVYSCVRRTRHRLGSFFDVITGLYLIFVTVNQGYSKHLYFDFWQMTYIC